MFEIDFPQHLIGETQETLAAGFGRDRSFNDERYQDSRFGGILAEKCIKHMLGIDTAMDVTRADGLYDFVYTNRAGKALVDIKSIVSPNLPKIDFRAYVHASQISFPANAYMFCYVSSSPEWRVWACSIIGKKSFLQRALLYRKGDVIRANGRIGEFHVRESAYFMLLHHGLVITSKDSLLSRLNSIVEEIGYYRVQKS